MKNKTILILVIVAAAVFAAYQWLKLQPIKAANKAIQVGDIDIENLNNGSELGVVTLNDEEMTSKQWPTLKDLEQMNEIGADEVVSNNIRGNIPVFYNLVQMKLGKNINLNRLDEWQGEPVTYGVIREMMYGYPNEVYQAANYNL